MMTFPERPSAPSAHRYAFAMTHSAAGGLREIWADIAEGLRARGAQAMCFTLYPPHDPAQDSGGGDWLHVMDQPPGGVLAVPGLFIRLVRFLRRHRPQVVVTAMPLANVLVPLAAIVAGTGTRVVTSHHSPVDTHNPAIDRLDALTGCLPCVAAIISVSDAVAATLDAKPAPYRARCRTIHNALPERIEAQLSVLAAGRAERHDGTSGTIVALGRLTRQKNYEMLLHAVSLAPAARLDLVGGGEDEAALRALAARLAIADRVRFLGQMPREAALAHAATAAIFVQVSLYEGHSLALIEAARLCLPLVVSDVPVQVEGITARDGTLCGLVVPVDNPAALAQVLSDLLEQPENRAAWAEKARLLGAQASHAAMLDAYESLLVSAAAQG